MSIRKRPEYGGKARAGPHGPEDAEGRDTPDPATVEEPSSSPTSPQPHGNCAPGQCGPDPRPWWRRRREASWRMVPLDGGCRDGWPCRCTEPPLSEKFIDAGRDAARHILEGGRVPLLELEVLRALYRRGGDDRQLAQELYELTGGEVG